MRSLINGKNICILMAAGVSMLGSEVFAAQIFNGRGTTNALGTQRFNITAVDSVANPIQTNYGTSSSLIHVTYAGQYQITVTAQTCISGANSYTNVGISINGVSKIGTTNRANECGSATATIVQDLGANGMIEGLCGNNSGRTTDCSMSIVKF